MIRVEYVSSVSPRVVALLKAIPSPVVGDATLYTDGSGVSGEVRWKTAHYGFMWSNGDLVVRDCAHASRRDADRIRNEIQAFLNTVLTPEYRALSANLYA